MSAVRIWIIGILLLGGCTALGIVPEESVSPNGSRLTPKPSSKQPSAITVLTGSNTPGFKDGKGLESRFHSLAEIAIDSENNLYVADVRNHSIRQVKLNGETITFAGAGNGGNQDGNRKQATFYYPSVIAIDSSENYIYTIVYTMEPNSKTRNKIRKIPLGNAAESTSTLPLDTISEARCREPESIAFDQQGNLFFGSDQSYICKMDTQGNVTYFAGAGERREGVLGDPFNYFTDGSLQEARFRGVNMVIHPDGTIYLVDGGNQRIRRISTDGQVSTIAGSSTEEPQGAFDQPFAGGFADGPGDQALFYNPSYIDFDTQGNLYVTDSANHRVRKIDTNHVVSTLVENIRFPSGIAVNRKLNLLYVTTEHRILQVDLNMISDADLPLRPPE